ncbi:hypothetical protein EVA_03042 [gut metagenome]|uniref:Uncharacterized protein n=1 Tax=gut metagenome TaxID=749906 RepID=J9D7S0_9ZZZZ
MYRFYCSIIHISCYFRYFFSQYRQTFQDFETDGFILFV